VIAEVWLEIGSEGDVCVWIGIGYFGGGEDWRGTVCNEMEILMWDVG
jgi:hypothetical protein